MAVHIIKDCNELRLIQVVTDEGRKLVAELASAALGLSNQNPTRNRCDGNDKTFDDVNRSN